MLKDLKTLIQALSFEYAHEARENAYACMAPRQAFRLRVLLLARREHGRGPRTARSKSSMLERLSDPLTWGDVYARTRAATS